MVPAEAATLGQSRPPSPFFAAFLSSLVRFGPRLPRYPSKLGVRNDEVEDGTASNVLASELGERSGDGFLVVWDYIDGPDGLYGQVFDGSAVAQGSPIEVTAGSYGNARLQGLDTGGLMAVWRSGLSRAKRRSFDASATGAAAVDISPLAGLQRWTDVTALPGGRAAVTWLTIPDNGPYRIDAQLITADSQIDTEWQVDTAAVSLNRSRIAYDPASAQLIILWTRLGSANGDQEDIILRRYSLETPIFIDGFESGDLLGWSGSVL